MSTFTYANWPNGSANEQYFALKEVLERAPAQVCLDQACNKRTIPMQSGRSINLRRWTNPAINLTQAQVTEGVTPTARTLGYTDYTGQMVRYAELFAVTRYDYDLHPYDAVKGCVDVMVTTVASDRERIRYNAAVGGNNVIYNSAAIASRATVNGTITLGRIQTAIRAIRASKGEAFTPAENGQNKEGTSPVEAAYFMFGHTDSEPDLRALPGFKTVAEYPSGKALPYEFGSIQNVRIFTTAELIPFANAGASSSTLISTNTSGTTAGTADVYPFVICAQNFLTSITLEGRGAKGFGNAKARVLDQADKSDPTNERIYISFDWYDLCLITAQEWGYRIECGVTRNP